MGLLERTSALDDLKRWLGDARARRGRLVLVEGEAGVGKKSRLGEFAAAWVVVFEDLHWADEATLDLLRFLARRIARRPAMIVASYRDDAVGPAHPLRLLLGDLANVATVRRLPIRPLSREAVAQLADHSGIDPERLYATTGGNPFYVTEVIAAEASAAPGGEIPATVRDAVLARAGRLSPAARQVLDAAAIVTPPVETWLLAEVSGSAPDHLDECVALVGPRRGVAHEGDHLAA